MKQNGKGGLSNELAPPHLRIHLHMKMKLSCCYYSRKAMIIGVSTVNRTDCLASCILALARALLVSFRRFIYESWLPASREHSSHCGCASSSRVGRRVSASQNIQSAMRQICADANNKRRIFFPIPHIIILWLLKVFEILRLKLPVRSDSVIGLVYSDQNPIFEEYRYDDLDFPGFRKFDNKYLNNLRQRKFND